MISVALVTRNRPTSLERTLTSLRAQDTQPFEVIVSDDSDEPAATEVRTLAMRFDCRYLTGPRRGLYANRNNAALACMGSHIRTMDDDHEFPRGHMVACLTAVNEDPSAVWIIGEHVPGGPPGQEHVCPAQLHPRGFSTTPPIGAPCWSIADGASVYPREIFDRGLRFTEEFPFGAAYLEWGSRLHWLGYRINHLANTYVIHHYDQTTRSHNDPTMELSARFFATLAHSFLYQPLMRNRTLTVAEIVRQLARHPTLAAPALQRALRVYRRQRTAIYGAASMRSCDQL